MNNIILKRSHSLKILNIVFYEELQIDDYSLLVDNNEQHELDIDDDE